MKNRFTSFLVLILVAVISIPTLKAEDIRGQVLYQEDISRPIGYVTVTLKDANSKTVQTYNTGADGFYYFPNVPVGKYTITGTTNIASRKATYYDAILVFLHLIGRYDFTPMQMLASDVNNSGTVDLTDYTLFLKNILTGKPFPATPWKFLTLDITLTNLKEYNPKGLGGTCSGDVGGTFVPTSNSAPAMPIVQEGSINVMAGEAFTTQILTHSDLSVSGTGLIIDYPSDLLQIESVEFKGADYQYNIDNGQIRLIWGDPTVSPVTFNDGEAFLTIHGTTTSAFKEGMTAGISLDGSSSVVNSSNAPETKLNFASPLIKYGKPSLKVSNYPNPFKNATKLNIYSPEAGNATIEVYGTNGQLVKRFAIGELGAGNQEVNMDASELTKGYYVCKVRVQTKTSEFTSSIRLLKAE